ncbi:MAG: hypothetical protein JWR15_4206, partial [Prosthecobacter sp.]|nr:hypothetical protein [Prosthecobacter sp.]
EQIWDSFVTLAKGNIDDSVDDENARLHQYLDDLSMFLGTVKSKGAEGLVQIAKDGRAKLDDNQKKVDELKAKLAADKAKGLDITAASKQLAKEASTLRKASEKDILIALLGKERADDLRQGYRPERPDKDKRPAIDKKSLESMTKEQRKEFMKAYQRNNSGKDGMGLSARASEQPSPARAGTFLRTFGQSDRELIQNANDDASVPQALTLLNGPAADVINNPASKLNQAIAQAGSPAQKIETLYQAMLSRTPTADEQAVINAAIQERGDKAVADVTHALVTGSQFLFVQ